MRSARIGPDRLCPAGAALRSGADDGAVAIVEGGAFLDGERLSEAAHPSWSLRSMSSASSSAGLPVGLGDKPDHSRH
jgi:hypothetical protein